VGEKGYVGGAFGEAAQELQGCTHAEKAESTHGGLITFSEQ
jgi:hypothetical protein